MFALRQVDDGSAKFIAQGGGSETDGNFGVIFDESGALPIEAGFGRGTGANISRTFAFLTRTDGTRVYLSVDTGTTLVVSATHP